MIYNEVRVKKGNRKLKYIKKSDFKRVYDYLYVINNLLCINCNKIIKVDNTTYNIIILSDYLKENWNNNPFDC